MKVTYHPLRKERQWTQGWFSCTIVGFATLLEYLVLEMKCWQHQIVKLVVQLQ